MKIALITGGNRGIGRATALSTAAKGHDILLTYRSHKQEAEEVIALIEKRGRKAVALPLDVSDTKSFAAFKETVKETLKHTWKRETFDFLVNNAGFGLYLSFTQTTEAHFDQLTNVNFKGVFFLIQTLLPLIADGGRIINVSSLTARTFVPNHTAYAPLKAAVEVLTRYLAVELGPRGITVNVVAPGPTATDYGEGLVRDNATVNQQLASQTPLGRVGQPEDIGALVAILLSEETSWVNGQRIEAAGGICL